VPYEFRAARSDGAIVSGVLDAESETQASATLADRGLYALSVRPAEAERQRPASRRDLALAFRSLATLVSAGVPLERALASTEPVARGPLKDLLALARTRLHEGSSLAGALAAGRGVVPDVVLGMIRAGERGSQLGPALDQVAAHLEQEAELLGRVRQALAYPAALAVVGTISLCVITLLVVPKFVGLLGDLGQALPPATRALVTLSDILARFWLPLLAAVLGGVWLALESRRRPAGRLRWDATLLVTPLIGPVRHALATARVTRALGGMLRAGMPMLNALDAAREAAGDAAVGDRLSKARERVARGEPLATSLDREAALAPGAIDLIAVGESSGRLADLCLKAGDMAGRTAERDLKTLVTLLEPALIVGFGGVVAFVAAALLQALYSLRP
jgi:general secretion pathway protein F